MNEVAFVLAQMIAAKTDFVRFVIFKNPADTIVPGCYHITILYHLPVTTDWPQSTSMTGKTHVLALQ